MSQKEQDRAQTRKKAVALSYDVEDGAPKVLAAGQGYLAEKIIEKAEQADVPLYRDDELVKSLLDLEIGELIPAELYEVVAEILVYVDKMERLKEKMDLHR